MAYVQENWFDIMTSSLVIVGSIILLLSLTISNSSIVYVSIVGYSLIIFSILLILVNILTADVIVDPVSVFLKCSEIYFSSAIIIINIIS